MTSVVDAGVIALTTNPWYWRFALGIQGMFDTRPRQYGGTVLAGLCFFAFIYVLHRVGSPLKERYDRNGVEILQSIVGSIGAILTSVFLLFVWRLANELQAAFSSFSVDHQTGVLALVTFVTLSITYSLTRITKRLIKYTERLAITPHQRELAHHGVQIGLFVLAASFVFALWNFDPTNLLIGAGAIGVVLGFAARKTLSGVLSGFVILFGRPFEVGDWIAVDDWEGIVTQITVYNTPVRTFNEEHVLIPNDTVTDSEVINYSKTDRLRLRTDIGIDYDTDIATAAGVATEAMESCEEVAKTPSPDVIRKSFADSAIVLQLRYWIDRPTIQQKLGAQNEVIEAVKDAFDDEGIKIPYPQRELLGRGEAGGLHVVPTTADEGAELDGAFRRAPPRRQAATDVEEPVEEDYAGDPDEADADSEGEAETYRSAESGDVGE